jgi:hypothetical protein
VGTSSLGEFCRQSTSIYLSMHGEFTVPTLARWGVVTARGVGLNDNYMLCYINGLITPESNAVRCRAGASSNYMDYSIGWGRCDATGQTGGVTGPSIDGIIVWYR